MHNLYNYIFMAVAILDGYPVNAYGVIILLPYVALIEQESYIVSHSRSMMYTSLYTCRLQ